MTVNIEGGAGHAFFKEMFPTCGGVQSIGLS